MTPISEIILTAFIIFLGISFGAGLYEMRIVLPMWFPKSTNGLHIDVPAMEQTDPGRKFWAFVSTGPLTLLTIASLAMTWHPESEPYQWWHYAAAATFFERVITFAFFIPNIIKIQKTGDTPDARKRAKLWVLINYIRMVLGLVGWLFALHAAFIS